MIEASVTDERGMPILAQGLPLKIADPFDYGGGHINPNKAAEPGLVYDIDPSGYNKFIGCTFDKFLSCNKTVLPGYHLNLPSIAIPDLRNPITVLRTVTNVGEVNAVYQAEIQSPPGVKVDVEPSVLSFNAWLGAVVPLRGRAARRPAAEKGDDVGEEKDLGQLGHIQL